MAMFDYTEITNSIHNYQKISNNFESLNSDLRSLQKKISSDNSWSGEAANYYKSELSKLFKNLDDISIAFKNIPNYVSRIEANHRKIDSL